MLSIGVVLGGPEKTIIEEPLRRLTGAVVEERGHLILGSAGVVNVVFHVPGRLAPDVGFEGLRDGTFFRQKKLLMIQVAVPQEIAASEDDEVITKFLFDSLREANKIAAKYFKKKGIEYSQPKFLGLVDAVEAKFKSP